MVKGLPDEAGERIVHARDEAAFASSQDLLERALLDRRELGLLASAGALQGLEGHRHKARWAVAGAERPDGLFTSMQRYEPTPLLQKPTEGQDLVADYQSTGLTLGRHPLQLIRQHLDRYHYQTAETLPARRNGEVLNVAGIVITKQRPGTASGVTFVTLEDESGYINLVVWKQLAETYRAALLNAKLMGVRGEVQIEGDVIHVIAKQLVDHSDLLGNLLLKSRDFR